MMPLKLKLKHANTLLLTLALALSLPAHGLSIKQATRIKVNRLISRYHPKIGLVIANNKGTIISKKNNKQFFSSASILKLFTASAALLSLGPRFRYKTSLLFTGRKRSTTLNGNVYLRFSGDPSLTMRDINNFFNTIQARGIRTIKGNVYLDDYQFNHTQYPPGTAVDDLAYSYASPVDAMTIDENKFGLTITPSKPNTAPVLTSSLPDHTVYYNNHLLCTKQKKHCHIIIRSDGHNHYSLSGCVPIKSGKQAESLAIRNVFTVANKRIHQILLNHKLVLTGHISQGRTPLNAIVINTHLSPPLSQLIYRMLKDSDNLISNTLIKTMSLHRNRKQGDFKSGLKIMKRVLAPITGIRFHNTRIKDGAGLSAYNLITPNQVLKLLIAIKNNPILRKTILPALPIAGRDGTLADRMHILAKRRRLRAKTGTLTGVSNIAGYCRTKHHGKLMFVLMINQYITKAKPIRRWTNQYLTTLALK